MITLLEKIHLLIDSLQDMGFETFRYNTPEKKFTIEYFDERLTIIVNNNFVIDFLSPNEEKFIDQYEFNKFLKYYFLNFGDLSLDEYYNLMQMNETEIILDLLQDE
jgi:hypothetical protein